MNRVDFSRMLDEGLIRSPFQNQLWEDLALEHEKIIWGVVFHALQEITGRDMAAPEMAQKVNEHLGLEFPDHHKYFDVMWHREPIVRVYRVGIMKFSNGMIRRHRRIEQLWRKRWNVLPKH